MKKRTKWLLTVMAVLMVILVFTTVNRDAQAWDPSASSVRVVRLYASDWTNQNPIIGLYDIGVEIDTGRFKFGDGNTAWTELMYASTANTFFTTATATTTYKTGHCGSTIGVLTDGILTIPDVSWAGCKFTFKNIGAAGNNQMKIYTATGTPTFKGLCTGMTSSNYTPTIFSASTCTALTNTKATAKQGDTVSIISGPSGTIWYLDTICTGTFTSP
jgi:hypothetical protein